MVALSSFRLLCNHHHHHFQNSLHPAKLKVCAHHSVTSILPSPAACSLLSVCVGLLLKRSPTGGITHHLFVIVLLHLAWWPQGPCTHRGWTRPTVGSPSLYSLNDAPLYAHNMPSYPSNSQWARGSPSCLSYHEESGRGLKYTTAPLGVRPPFLGVCTQKWKCWVV